MITKTFRVRGLVPKERDGPKTGHEVQDFTERIVKYSQLISESKKTSADNSISTLLIKAFKKCLLQSTPKQRNHKPGHQCDMGYATIGAVIGPKRADSMVVVNWNVEATYKIQKDVNLINHKKKMKDADNDEFKAYGWCDLLCTDEWLQYISNPLNDSARNKFIVKMMNSAKHPEYAPPPYGIHYESMAVTIGKIENLVRHVDQRHLNGYDMIPMIVTILHAKKKNDTLSNVVSDELNKNMINYICRYIYGMKGYNNNTLHPAVEFYLPTDVKAQFLNDCVEKYQVLPVTVFLITLYNSCFMFQEKKDDNNLIKALEHVNLTPGLDDNTFFSTMSK